MKRLISYSIIAISTFTANAAIISGSIDLNNPSILSVSRIDGSYKNIDIKPEEKSYSINLDASTPEIMTLFLTYTDEAGKKMQLYTPIYIDKDIYISLNIKNNNGQISFETEDKELSSFIEYNDFIKNNFKLPTDSSEDSIYLQGFNSKADELKEKMNHKLAYDYMELWGINARNTAGLMLSRRDRKNGITNSTHDKQIVDVDRLINNSAAIYYPVIVAMIIQEKAKGQDITQKIASIRENIPEGTLRQHIETKLINEYVTQNKSNENSSEVLATLDSVAKDMPQYNDWVSAIKGYKSFSQPGDEAPDDIFYDVNGNIVRLSDFKGKNIFIDLWASWCTYCIKELPYIHKIEEEFSDSDIIFIGISFDENLESWKNALKKHNLKGNQLIISSPEFAEKLQISALPQYLLYGKDGKLINNNTPRPHKHDALSQLLKSLN